MCNRIVKDDSAEDDDCTVVLAFGDVKFKSQILVKRICNDLRHRDLKVWSVEDNCTSRLYSCCQK